MQTDYGSQEQTEYHENLTKVDSIMFCIKKVQLANSKYTEKVWVD